MLNLNGVWVPLSVGATHAQVAAAVHHVAGVAAQAISHEVGAEPLSGAARIDAHPGRAPYDTGVVVYLDRPPRAPRVGRGRAARRCRLERFCQRSRGRTFARLAVAEALDVSGQGRVQQPPGAIGRFQGGAHLKAEQVGGGDLRAGVAVQLRKLRFGLEARQRAVELLDEGSRPVGGPGWSGRFGSTGGPLSRRMSEPMQRKVRSCSGSLMATRPPPGRAVRACEARRAGGSAGSGPRVDKRSAARSAPPTPAATGAAPSLPAPSR